MPFIPHTEDDISKMLAAIGVNSIAELFDEIPPELLIGRLEGVPPTLSELETARLMRRRAAQDAGATCFIGAGAYDHYVPAAVWEIVTRGEYYSAYTPYQAEASQGTLQTIYEYQSMMAMLTGMDVSNASLYDGASALTEAVLMAVRLDRKKGSRRVLMPATVHPAYRAVVRTIVRNQGIELVDLPYSRDGGRIDPSSLGTLRGQDAAALVVPQPNVFGVLEEVDELTAWGHENGMLVIGVVNPVAVALLAPPGEWAGTGADIACGEGQPLGVPLSSGGPYFGFLTCKRALVRQMPGRIVGRTIDLEGRPGYTLTLQAREQHIRRSKATSNICTNQGLLATAATIHMALLGPEGLYRVACASHANTISLVEKLTTLDGVEPVFDRPIFHEAVLRIAAPPKDVLRSLAAHNVLGGYDLGQHYPELDNCILVCATEARTAEDAERYAGLMDRILKTRTAARCPVEPKL